MPTPSGAEITSLLEAWSHGDRAALDRLIPVLYDELKRLAHGRMQHERPDHLLQTTALVHEAYLRLVGVTRVRWEDRAHFFAVAAQVMRRVLVDTARGRDAQKRGGGLPLLPLDAVEPRQAPPPVDVLDLDRALHALARAYPRQARVVELRYFGGLSVEEAGEVLGVSSDTVHRDWNFARLWLMRELRGTAPPPEAMP
jgi:RNA polymerase sigma factor (TIGR02999 family)